MIDEATWHRDEDSQRRFVWCATSEGIQLHHTNENPSYVIPWSSFQAIHQQARNLAQANGNAIPAGTNQNSPTPGSVGEWVLQQNFSLTTGYLTPRHLSFIGPILGRMGFITRRIEGNSILWVFS